MGFYLVAGSILLASIILPSSQYTPSMTATFLYLKVQCTLSGLGIGAYLVAGFILLVSIISQPNQYTPSLLLYLCIVLLLVPPDPSYDLSYTFLCAP